LCGYSGSDCTKVSYLGIALLLLGLVVIGSAYAGYPLSVASTPTQNYSVSANVSAVSSIEMIDGGLHYVSNQTIPSTESNPWALAQFYGSGNTISSPITIEYYGLVRGMTYSHVTYYNTTLGTVSRNYALGNGVSRWANSASGTIDVTLTITNESSGQTALYTVPVSVAVSISFKLTSRQVNNALVVSTIFYATITGSSTFAFHDPYSSSVNSAVYAFQFNSGSGVISSGNTSYTITLNPSKTVYGRFTVPPPPSNSSYIINTYGNFWVGTSLNSMTKIVSWAQTLNLNVPSFPAPLYIVFIFNGSIPANYNNVYYTYDIYNGTTLASSGIVSFYNQPTKAVTVNGHFYPFAFVSTLNISGPSDIVLQGVYVTSENLSLPLMEIGGFSDNAPVQPAFSTQQYISFGIGAVLILIGAVWIFKR